MLKRLILIRGIEGLMVLLLAERRLHFTASS